jgi:hypothetical protein
LLLFNAYFSRPDIKTPSYRPHKFAHLDYTALENILITDPRKSKNARVSLHNPTADRWHLVLDSWLFDSQCHCSSPPPLPISPTLSPFWYVNYVLSWRFWSGKHVILGGFRLVILHDSNLDRVTHCPDWDCLWFSSVPPSKYWDITSIRLRSHPSKSLPIHHSSYNLTLWGRRTTHKRKVHG